MLQRQNVVAEDERRAILALTVQLVAQERARLIEEAAAAKAAAEEAAAARQAALEQEDGEF